LTVLAERHVPWPTTAGPDAVSARVGAWSRRLAARWLVSQHLELHVSGMEHVPPRGAAILVARHYHHLYDAAAILASVSREVHVVVAVDWLGDGWRLAVMRRLASAARWPAVWRRGPRWRFNREAYQSSLRVLERGRLLLVFPEAYPTIDPLGTTRPHDDAFLPFDPGFLVVSARARSDVPIIPAGLWYTRREDGGWRVWLRFGPPLSIAGEGRRGRRAALARVESAVRCLSAEPD
jgi:putative membrane protein